MTLNTSRVTAVLALLALVLIPSSLAAPPGGKGGGGGGSGKTCTRGTPGVAVDNTWWWAQTGSYGLPGQQLKYAVKVVNNDVGCSASSFTVGLSGPDGFAVSLPTTSVSVSAMQTGYVWATVTSPAGAADGDYPLTATVVRAGTSSPTASYTSYYKVYSTDTTAPELYWAAPGDGVTVTGKTYTVSVAARDDHSVRKVDLSMDGRYVTTTTCDGVSYACRLYYTWAVKAGAHTATFTATDWMGNISTQTVRFTA